ncbi:hypothetical protein Tco_0000793 [Tanacetum coccineum]
MNLAWFRQSLRCRRLWSAARARGAIALVADDEHFNFGNIPIAYTTDTRPVFVLCDEDTYDVVRSCQIPFNSDLVSSRHDYRDSHACLLIDAAGCRDAHRARSRMLPDKPGLTPSHVVAATEGTFDWHSGKKTCTSEYEFWTKGPKTNTSPAATREKLRSSGYNSSYVIHTVKVNLLAVEECKLVTMTDLNSSITSITEVTASLCTYHHIYIGTDDKDWMRLYHLVESKPEGKFQSYSLKSELIEVHQRLEFPLPLSESGCSVAYGSTLRTSSPITHPLNVQLPTLNSAAKFPHQGVGYLNI